MGLQKDEQMISGLNKDLPLCEEEGNWEIPLQSSILIASISVSSSLDETVNYMHDCLWFSCFVRSIRLFTSVSSTCNLRHPSAAASAK